MKPPIGPAAGLPPVIVLNLFHSGLGIVRQLAGRGVRVVGLSANHRIYGNFTRFCEVREAPNSQEEPQQLFDYLLRASDELIGAIIFPTRDADLLFLDRFRGDLEKLYKLAIPPRSVLSRLIDKGALAEAATEAGISIPRTALVSEQAHLEKVASLVGFPCVVKPVRSIHWRHGNHWKEVGGRKAFRVENFVQLQEAYDRISPVRAEVLLQEWIPGGTDQIVVWGGYVKLGQEPQAHFTARKLVQSPDEFGTGCVVESFHIPDLLEPSLRLCRVLGYEGIAEVEYKRDARDGALKLIEINARHWDWHELSRVSHANLTWSAYCDLTGIPAQSAGLPVQRAKWIAEDALLTHILASFYGGQSRSLHLWSALAGRRVYGIFAWNDPLPFLRYSVTTLLPGLARVAIGKIRRSILGTVEVKRARTALS